MAFQIQDDLLDFEGEEKETGKLLAQDLKEGVITLPVILLLNKSEYKKKYSAYSNSNLDDKIVKDIIDDVKNSGVLEESREILFVFVDRVKKYLAQLPDNKSKRKLKKLIEVQVERKF
jgi:heptaprenyl diphosphate synthase